MRVHGYNYIYNSMISYLDFIRFISMKNAVLLYNNKSTVINAFPYKRYSENNNTTAA